MASERLSAPWVAEESAPWGLGNRAWAPQDPGPPLGLSPPPRAVPGRGAPSPSPGPFENPAHSKAPASSTGHLAARGILGGCSTFQASPLTSPGAHVRTEGCSGSTQHRAHPQGPVTGALLLLQCWLRTSRSHPGAPSPARAGQTGALPWGGEPSTTRAPARLGECCASRGRLLWAGSWLQSYLLTCEVSHPQLHWRSSPAGSQASPAHSFSLGLSPAHGVLAEISLHGTPPSPLRALCVSGPQSAPHPRATLFPSLT